MEDNKVIFSAKALAHYPEYMTSGSAGGDLSAWNDWIIGPHETVKIPSGLKVKLPKGYALIVKPRSSLAVNRGLLVVEGTIDSDYRGEISIVVHNLTDKEILIEDKERIAQAVIIKLADFEYTRSMDYDTFEELYPTDRGSGGFGSTGNF